MRNGKSEFGERKISLDENQRREHGCSLADGVPGAGGRAAECGFAELDAQVFVIQ